MTAPLVPVVVQRLRVLVACLLLVALAFSQSPGQLTADTKLDLAVAPLRFLGRALHLWDPAGAFGQLQNQAYGYLFPMGPFFALGELVDAPGWVVQRLWLSLVLVTALLGARALARELGIGTPATQLLAGVAYALSPRVLTVGGPISIEAWPLAVLPWVVVPLVRGARGGSVRRAAALSGVAVLCIGGVNAAATLAVLPLAGLFLLTRLGSPRGRRLAAWWALAVPLAALWWALPLVLLGRYSLPFLDYIETAAVTTSTTSLVEVLRGTSHWLAYVAVGDGPWWRAGWALVTDPLLIAATALVAGLGLAGLLRRDVPERVFLLGGVLLGTLLVTAGHVGSLPGWLEPPLAGPLRELLDGPLAPFRNVHKFDAVLRLPLVLGLAHLASSVRWQRAERVPEVLRPVASRPVAALAVVGLLVGATPLLTGSLAPRGSFTAFPEAWPAVASWLEESAPEGRALVVPGASFGEYVWGRPLDEPLQPLAGSPWAVRNAVPLGTEGNTRLLDGVEELLESGRGSAGLAPLLRRAGVSHVVVRNDLDWLSAGASWPYLASRALTGSPGVELVQSFGNRDERIPRARGLRGRRPRRPRRHLRRRLPRPPQRWPGVPAGGGRGRARPARGPPRGPGRRGRRRRGGHRRHGRLAPARGRLRPHPRGVQRDAGGRRPAPAGPARGRPRRRPRRRAPHHRGVRGGARGARVLLRQRPGVAPPGRAQPPAGLRRGRRPRDRLAAAGRAGRRRVARAGPRRADAGRVGDPVPAPRGAAAPAGGGCGRPAGDPARHHRRGQRRGRRRRHDRHRQRRPAARSDGAGAGHGEPARERSAARRPGGGDGPGRRRAPGPRLPGRRRAGAGRPGRRGALAHRGRALVLRPRRSDRRLLHRQPAPGRRGGRPAGTRLPHGHHHRRGAAGDRTTGAG